MLTGRTYGKSPRGTAPVALVLACPLLVLTSLAVAGPAGPLEVGQDGVLETMDRTPEPPLAQAREAVKAPYLNVPASDGVNQRLLHPFIFQRSSAELPDFTQIEDISRRKTDFFDFLQPLVRAENNRLLEIRRRLGYIHDHVRFHRPLNEEDREWLQEIVEQFRCPVKDPAAPGFWKKLLLRVDALPEELVLVQAANESAWGTSRFAREGNNLFGQWCFRPGCGMVPGGRPQGETYEVARFESVAESISSYMHNLNTGRVYGDLRQIRAASRASGLDPDAAEMAKGLTRYSERGMAYVTEIRAMLRHNASMMARFANR
jgi:Bax protein